MVFFLAPPPRRYETMETTADRIVREAMEAGEFDDLPGTGKPIPGKGTVDDDMWWVRSWLERNREPDDQDSRSPE
jgi:hypothetical protein